MTAVLRDRPIPVYRNGDDVTPTCWLIPRVPPGTAPPNWRDALHRPDLPVWWVDTPAGLGITTSGRLTEATDGALPVRAYVPPVQPESLGDAAFRTDHGLRYAYVAGAMANGIASELLVEAMSHAGMLGFFGAAGLSPTRVQRAVEHLQTSLGGRPFGCNLIHSPHEPGTEAAVASLYAAKGVRLVEASAYLDLTLPVVRYRLHGIRRDSEGRIVTANRVVAKISRVEVAAKFMAPPPQNFINQLVADGDLTDEQAAMARSVPLAQDITAEADSGGHTDNRPMLALLPTIIALRDRLQKQYGYVEPLRVGAAGGIGTPASCAAAFALGAAYVVTGSINQACVESGSSALVRTMLAEAGQADVVMAPAADMFEMGVRVQVLKRGTMFAMRAARLFDVYRNFDCLEAIPPTEQTRLERDVFRMPLGDVWRDTQRYWAAREPQQLDRAERDPKHRMALVFRWYLGLSSRWANEGVADRRADFQVWCGPAMSAFNEWARGSFLERPENRRVAVVARQLLHGAAVHTRIQFLRAQGIAVPVEVASIPPRENLEAA